MHECPDCGSTCYCPGGIDRSNCEHDCEDELEEGPDDLDTDDLVVDEDDLEALA